MNIQTGISKAVFIGKSPNLAGFGFQQVRNKWATWMQIRDAKRRRMASEVFLERTRINSLRKNDILPIEIRELADKEINKFELNCVPMRINYRCAITGRARAIVPQYRLSRFVWRHLADYNKLSGVQRAMWGYTGSSKF